MWSQETREREPSGPWIRSRGWDLAFVFGTAALVVVPLLTYHAIASATGVEPRAFQHQQALGIAMLINLAVAFLIGGPHVYATYTMTLGERRFRQRHPWLLWAGAALPFVVITLAIVRIELLIASFFAWASVHVLHQITYLVQQYQRRGGPLSAASKAIDVVLAVTCLYPVATWRLLAPEGAVLRLPFGIEVQPGFLIGQVDVAQQLPAFVRGEVWIAECVSAVFLVSLVLFLGRTVLELAQRRVVWPRTLLLLLTVPIAFGLPIFDNMDVALQGFNLWHSAQYLGLVYLMNSYRRQKGVVSSGFVHWLSGLDRTHAFRYYAFVVAISVGVGGLIGVLHYGAGLPMLQVYYAVHLSGLLVHYLWDHAVFLQRDALTPGLAAH